MSQHIANEKNKNDKACKLKTLLEAYLHGETLHSVNLLKHQEFMIEKSPKLINVFIWNNCR